MLQPDFVPALFNLPALAGLPPRLREALGWGEVRPHRL